MLMIKWACCVFFVLFFYFRPTLRFWKYFLAEWILKWVNASRRLLVSDLSHPVLWIFLRGTSWWNAALDRWLSAKLFLFLCQQLPSHWLTIDLNSMRPDAQWSGLVWFDVSWCAVMYLACQGDYALPVWSPRGHLTKLQPPRRVFVFILGEEVEVVVLVIQRRPSQRSLFPNEDVSWIFERSATVWLRAQMALLKAAGRV